MPTEPQIRFLTTAGGARIAYSALGSGPAIVRTPPWISHLDLEWKIPQFRTFIERLTPHHTVVRYDSHGCGLSDRNRLDFSIEAKVGLLELVVDSLDLDDRSVRWSASLSICSSCLLKDAVNWSRATRWWSGFGERG